MTRKRVKSPIRRCADAKQAIHIGRRGVLIGFEPKLQRPGVSTIAGKPISSGKRFQPGGVSPAHARSSLAMRS